MRTNKRRYYAILYSTQRVHYETDSCGGDSGSNPGKSKDMCLHSFRTVSEAHSISNGTVRGCIARDRAVKMLDYFHLRSVTAAIPLLPTRVHSQKHNCTPIMDEADVQVTAHRDKFL